MIHRIFLTFDLISIQEKITENLQSMKYEVTTSLGFAGSGESALIISGKRNDKKAIRVYLENELKRITIYAGIIGENKSRLKGTFSNTELKQANDFYEKVRHFLESKLESI